MKTKIILPIVIALFVTFAGIAGAEENAGEKALSDLDKTYQKAKGGLEAWRLKTLAAIQTKKAEHRAKIENTERQYAASREGEILPPEAATENIFDPLKYPAFAFYTMAGFIFAEAFIFYGIILILITIILIRIFG